MFDYKQRPFDKTVTDEQYNIAVGRQPSPTKSSEFADLLEVLKTPTPKRTGRGRKNASR